MSHFCSFSEYSHGLILEVLDIENGRQGEGSAAGCPTHPNLELSIRARREKEKRMAKAKLNREEEARLKKEELEKKMKMKVQ